VNEVISVHTPGVIARIEMFTYAVEELRQFVIYTYYSKEEVPLYVGYSKDFANVKKKVDHLRRKKVGHFAQNDEKKVDHPGF